jgi:hypothetical protein
MIKQNNLLSFIIVRLQFFGIIFFFGYNFCGFGDFNENVINLLYLSINILNEYYLC